MLSSRPSSCWRGIVVYLFLRRDAPEDGRHAVGAVGSTDFQDCVRISLGPGEDFDFDIVGGASYLARLKHIVGPRFQAGETVVVPLLVVPEPDNPNDPNAIRIVFEGRGTVGYCICIRKGRERPGGYRWLPALARVRQIPRPRLRCNRRTLCARGV